MRTYGMGALAASVCMVALAVPAQAQAQEQAYNIPAGSLRSALDAFGHQSGKPIIYKVDEIRGLRSRGFQGTATPPAALDAILAGTMFTARIDGSGAIAIVKVGNGATKDESLLSVGDGETSRSENSEIVVTGSRIRGSEPTSPVRTTTRDDIEKLGINDLGTFARSIVQNYSGGQNPSIPGGGQGISENVSSSSTLNLRGLGPDATLTLFNGHRVAYDAMSQGVDISAIPLAAIDRVEVITDGSSALYGSDAVGGVANVLFRKDYEGATISARIGGSTDGGDFEQQYDIVTGKRWADGGFMIAYDFRDVTPITARQRSYAQSNDPTDTLQTGEKQHSGVVAGHQNITDQLSFEFDGQLNNRTSRLCVNYTVTDGCLGTGADIQIETRSWTASPSIKLAVAQAWDLRLASIFGESRAEQLAAVALGGFPYLTRRGTFTNRVQSLEVNAEGPLFRLPGGSAHLAIGAGQRKSKFILDIADIEGDRAIPVQNLSIDRSTNYVYGEIFLPLVSQLNNVPLINRLNFTAAVRYEDISHVGSIATPKLGFVYAPTREIALKFSWGKSFKAPTQYQSVRPRSGYSQVGATAFFPPSPVEGTVLYVSGGNADLKPERATNWTVTTTLTPSMIEGMKINASYFRIDYRDRVVSPIPQNLLAFSPIYSAYVNLNPSSEDVLATLEGITTLYDQGGGDPSPANVIAIVTNYLQNAAIQKVEGVDFSIDYKFKIGSSNHIDLHGSASYLDSEQQLSSSQPIVQIAGILYRPPHWRASSSVQWNNENLSLTSVFSYIGGTLDNRLTPYEKVGGFKSVDLVARYEIANDHGLFSNMTFLVSALNIFNEKPAYIRTTSSGGYHYDAGNYPITGRFLSIAISKSF